MDVCRDISIGWPAKCDRVREREPSAGLLCLVRARVCACIFEYIFVCMCVEAHSSSTCHRSIMYPGGDDKSVIAAISPPLNPTPFPSPAGSTHILHGYLPCGAVRTTTHPLRKKTNFSPFFEYARFV